MDSSSSSSATSSTSERIQRLILEWLSGAIANGFASGLLNPMDVCKTRMQAELVSRQSSNGLIATLRTLYRESGVTGLWKPGLNASLAREFLYSGPRAGFYVPLRDFFEKAFYGHSNGDHPSTKILAALTTGRSRIIFYYLLSFSGTIGSCVANPVDVAKIRLMVNPSLYPTVSNAVVSIYRHEGWLGLYRGLVPSTLRGASIAVGELATYDHSKTVVKEYFPVSEGIFLHSICSLITGLVATTVAAPFDLLKTR